MDINKHEKQGIFINGLHTNLKRSEIKHYLICLLCELGIKIKKSNINVILQKNRTFAFVYLDSREKVDYVLYCVCSEASRSKVNFDFSQISSGSNNFYIARIRNKTSTNNGFPVFDKRVSDAGTSSHSLGLSSHNINRTTGNVLDTATSVSGLTPHVQGKFYRYQENLGNETRNVEFKEGKGNYGRNILSEHVGKYICGFVNSLEGGTLFIGVNDKGLVKGIVCTHEEEDRLRLIIDEAVKSIIPSVFPVMYCVSFTPILNQGTFSENLKVVEITVYPSESHDELYEFKGSVYVRRDGSLQSLKPRDIKAWLQKRAAGDIAHNHLMKQQLTEVTNQLQQIQTQLIHNQKTRTKPDNCYPNAAIGDQVAVHYTGRLENGIVFDSSAQRDPIGFVLGAGRVIPGWEQGLLGMCVGEKRMLTIPSHLAYGSKGSPPQIPPDSTLIFETELMSLQQKGVEDIIFKTLRICAIPALVLYVIYYLYKKYKIETDVSSKTSKDKRSRKRK